MAHAQKAKAILDVAGIESLTRQTLAIYPTEHAERSVPREYLVKCHDHSFFLDPLSI